MAKKSVANAGERIRLSFDGGDRCRGGLGSWHPLPLSDEELRAAGMEDGKHIDSEGARYNAGCLIGQKAAKEYIARTRSEDSNFFDDSICSGFAGIAIDMLLGHEREDIVRQGQAIGFFGELYAYYAFGVRTIRKSDKLENAVNRPTKESVVARAAK